MSLRDEKHVETAEDLERLLLSEPQSSLLWIRYMALFLSAADVDAARRVAERALQSVGFRHEDEKFNVWVAYLNLEHKFGSMDTLEGVFGRAIQESKVVITQILDLLLISFSLDIH